MQQIPNANTFTDPESVAAHLIETVPLAMRTIRNLMRANTGVEVSVPHFRALRYVLRHPDCSVSDIAEHVGLSVAAASRLVDTLVERGLVVRQASTHDRRFVELRLSEEGERIQRAAHTQTLRELAGRLATLDDTERSTLMAAFDVLRTLFATAVETDATHSSDTEREL